MPSCPICDKVYVKDGAYQKHLIICKFIPPKSGTTETLPSYSELCYLLQQVTIKCAAMSQKIEVLETILNTKKKKIDVFEWLNTHIIPTHSYIDWVKTIVVKKAHLHYLFENNIVESVVNIIHEAILPLIPLYAFGKTQTFYVFINGAWIVASTQHMEHLFGHIDNEFWKRLKEWKIIHNNEMLVNDSMSAKYQKTISKLTDITCSTTDYNRMKTKIYNAIKMDIKSIVEEEIDFTMTTTTTTTTTT